MVSKEHNCPYDLGEFWSENLSLLKKLSKAKFPSSSVWKFYYREIAAGYVEDADEYYLDIFIVNMNNQTKRFGCIDVSFNPKNLRVKEERIYVGSDIHRCDLTLLKGYEIKSERHRKWLCDLLRRQLREEDSI